MKKILKYVAVLIALLFVQPCLSALYSSASNVNIWEMEKEGISEFWNTTKSNTKKAIDYLTTYLPKSTVENNQRNYQQRLVDETKHYVDTRPEGATEIIVPSQYHFTGKFGACYTDGQYEIFTAEIVWTGYNTYSNSDVPVAPYSNYIKLTRNNVSTATEMTETLPIRNLNCLVSNNCYYFSFQSFSSDTNIWSGRYFYFSGNSTNDIRYTNIVHHVTASEWYGCSLRQQNGNSSTIISPRYFTVVADTNNRTVYLDIINVHSTNNYNTAPVELNPIVSGTLINNSNYNNFSAFGFGINANGELSFDPEIAFQGYLDSLFDSLLGRFDLIYGSMSMPLDVNVNPDNTFNYIDIETDINNNGVDDNGGGGGNIIINLDELIVVIDDNLDEIIKRLNTIISILNDLPQNIQDILEYLFIPSDNNEWHELIELIYSKFGFIQQFIDLGEYLETVDFEDEPPEMVIDFDSETYGTFTANIIDWSYVAPYIPAVKAVTSGIILYCFIRRTRKRLPDIISGGGAG